MRRALHLHTYMSSISHLTQFYQLQLVSLTWLTQLHFGCRVRRQLSSCYTNKCNFHAPQMHVEHSYFMRMRSLFGFPIFVAFAFLFFSFSIFIFVFNFYLLYLFILLLPTAVKKMRIKCKFLCCEYPAEIRQWSCFDSANKITKAKSEVGFVGYTPEQSMLYLFIFICFVSCVLCAVHSLFAWLSLLCISAASHTCVCTYIYTYVCTLWEKIKKYNYFYLYLIFNLLFICTLLYSI